MRYGRPFILTCTYRLRAPPSSYSRFKSSSTRNTREGEHKDLRSFEAYVDRTGLNKASTVYRGTKYEYTAVDTLHRFFLNLQRQGGRDDLGIDLLGTWSLPTFIHPVNVLVSCKSNAKVALASWVRELEGAFAGDPRGPNHGRLIGFLVARGEATPGVRDALARSQLPLAFINITLEGNVRQIVWNAHVANMGLERVTPKIWNQELGTGDDIGEERTTVVLMENDQILDKVHGNRTDIS
ncbi:hypothetical protein EV356DRAFT_495626 [Viridothelium virens]|uniref:Uncharacterized protein n=1 Tax=Viridothelium virens TaxID=1048519 RepID=A0A6A6HPS0_VIRVR|nr:hypothetical protein EV356DRAFT_495626 [Viridothelium virens]